MCLESHSQESLQKWKFTEVCSNLILANTSMRLGRSGSKLEEWLNQNGKLPHIIEKITWSLQNEILWGKWKWTVLHQKNHLHRHGMKTMDSAAVWHCRLGGKTSKVRVSSIPALQKSGNARSRACKTQPTATTLFYVIGPWLSGYFWLWTQDFSTLKNWRKLTEEY